MPDNPPVTWVAPPVGGRQPAMTRSMRVKTAGIVFVDLAALWVGGFVAAIALILIGIFGLERGGPWRPIGWASWIALAVCVAFLIVVTIGVFVYGWR